MIGTDDDEAWLAMIAFGEPQGAVAQNDAAQGGEQLANRTTPTAALPISRVNAVESEDVVITGIRKGKEVSIDGTEPPAQKGKKRKSAEDGEGQAKKKKSKSSSSSRYRSFALDKPWSKKSYHEYVQDPIGAAIHTMVHMQDIADGYKAESAETIRELTEERDRALAELELARENNRLTVVTLVTNRSLMRKNEEVIARLEGDCRKEQEKVKGLQELVRRLENQEAAQSVELQKLVEKVADLEARLSAYNPAAGSSGESARVAELERKLAASEEKSQKVARMAFDFKGKYFQLALDQVIAVNPAMASMRSVFDVNCVVENGTIVKVNPQTKAKEVVYRPQVN